MGIKKVIKRAVTVVRIVSAGLAFAALTVFVFLNSFEVLFNKDISFIHALDTLHAQKMINDIVGEVNGNLFQLTSEKLGNFGSPQTLKIPSINSKLNLVKAIHVDGNWLYRANNGHYIVTSASKNGNVGDVVIYANTSWRTILAPGDIKIGDNLFLDTDSGWRYMFRITNKSTLHFDDAYVKREMPVNSLTLLVEDERNNVVYLFQGAFVNIQNTQQ